MILRHLSDYYKKCMELYPDEAPALGFEKRTLDYVLVINQDGTLSDTFNTDVECVVSRPASNKTSGAIADVLWGDEKYMLNIVDNSILDEPGKHCNEIIKMLVELVEAYPNRKDFVSLQLFYKQKEYKKLVDHKAYGKLKSCKAVSFLVQGQDRPVCAFSVELDNYLHKLAKNKPEAHCLVSGKKDNICLTSGSVLLGIATNGKIVSFQKGSGYDSQGKSQGENAPISIYEEYAYTAALKRLINSEDNSLKVYVKNPKSKDGLIIDRVLVYWSSAQNEDGIKAIEEPQNIFAHLDKYDPDDVINVKNFFADIKKGGIDGKYGKEKYYFLELVPTSQGRIAISFWNECSIIDFADIVMRHFDAMNLNTYHNIAIRYDALSMVNAVSPYKKSSGKTGYDRIPNMIDSVFRSIFSGTLYPEVLFKAAIGRIMAEQNRPILDKEPNDYWDFERRDAERAAICKAFLYRNYNQTNIKNMLNEEIKDKGYLCGRLFAVLEHTQERANFMTDGVWKSDLRSKYMNAAMTTPAIVFPAILANSNYYLDKLPHTRVEKIEMLKQKIIDQFTIEEKSNLPEVFPKTLSAVEQGCFFVGYYQQRVVLNPKKESNEETEDNN